ncbi:sodium-dependent neutral amino acid transporter SLC6A17-like [Chiloscyllium plagiosum]|uniref:sodium-dependent neutral amino acid transporter SLC6A17-like n=1 Tax=Chiloscyllium plagiosum TaxID=36176 RepID=UPI001CB7E9DC|nr:sodium-dependent neutral amino acid transporter SLC6A17-like [Chiloscyllium plagiosum]
MPKNSKVTQREHSNDPVTESVADLLAGEEPVDYKHSVLNVGGVPVTKDQDGGNAIENDDRPVWNNKLQYILAQIGYSVGLGNVWRFPYLCQKNGGGAYLVPYFILLLIIGIPLFFLELAVGQRIRRGSIGVWNYVCPRLGGIGFASCIVCFFVGLYYNVIIGWSIFYFFKSFQSPLPWSECPLITNGSVTIVEPECEKSSATTYFWYRDTLNIANNINEGGGLNWKMTLCLLSAWFLVGLCTIKGIQSSGKVMYFSSLFPYVVLICFLVRSLLLRGSIDGILHMFTPKILSDHITSWQISMTSPNFLPSICSSAAGLHICMSVNVDYFRTFLADLPHFTLHKHESVQGTGLAFIAFTEAMTHFPASPFWSVLFFLMLINLGLGSMMGTMEGIISPIVDTFKMRKEFLTIGCTIIAFSVGLIFVQRSGNYFVTMFDDYSATLPLTIVVILENISVSWIYGTKKFMQELTEMLGFTPYRYYYYTWKYISPLAMVILMLASIIQMGITPPGYNAWIMEEATERFLIFPGWAMGLTVTLIVLGVLPIPIVFIVRHFHLVSDGSNTLSVSYNRGRMMKDMSNLDDHDETRFILSKVPSETPSPMPIHRSYNGPDSISPLEMTAANGRYGIGYLSAGTPESEL